ncbi:MAG: flagellar hook-associated protein 3, partial [Gammaproteobacteria bacterium]|nr:flagellar hook-associated protein 3 [Gammaproteobacteria bacterium]
MRISTLQLQLTGISAILDRQAEVSRTQNQLATGKRILSPADDPAGAASIENFRQAIERTGQFQDNIILARQRLNVEESNLESAGNIL